MTIRKTARRAHVRASSAAFAVGVLTVTVGACSPGETATATAGATATVTVTETTIPDAVDVPEEPEEEVEETSFVPKPSDFKIDLRIREKECFGSAGCIVTYQINPRYTGTTSLGDGAYDVTYEVTGGEDPIINTFQIDAGSASFDEEEEVDTQSSAVKLRARVTAVYER